MWQSDQSERVSDWILISCQQQRGHLESGGGEGRREKGGEGEVDKAREKEAGEREREREREGETEREVHPRKCFPCFTSVGYASEKD